MEKQILHLTVSLFASMLYHIHHSASPLFLNYNIEYSFPVYAVNTVHWRLTREINYGETEKSILSWLTI